MSCLTNGDDVALTFGRTGDKGGAGADGTSAGLDFTFDTGTTDADPGGGALRANNASLASATELYVDDLTAAGANVEDFLLTLDVSTNTIKGHLVIKKRDAKENYVIYSVSSITDATGYVKIGVSYVDSAGSFSDSDALTVEFSRAGDAGGVSTDAISVLGSVQDATNLNQPHDVRIQGDYAYVVGKGGTFAIVDISDPANPAVLGSITTLTDAQSVEVFGSYAYVFDDGGLTVYDVEDPTTPTEVTTVAQGVPDVWVGAIWRCVNPDDILRVEQ